MWATALTICALVALLAALGYTALAARRLEATLGARARPRASYSRTWLLTSNNL